MENEPELIRDQMQETRTALTEKLDTLQQKVSDTVESITTPVAETVQTVKDAVSDTVSTVQETVSDTVASVKDTFNLTRQVEQHPWPIMFGSVAAGFLLGRILPSPRQVARSVGSTAHAMAVPTVPANQAMSTLASGGEAVEEKNGIFSTLSKAFQGEMDKITGLGISVGVGLLRDLMTSSMQGEVGGRVREWMDGVTQQLGGKPLAEPLVTPTSGEESPPTERKWESEKETGSKEASKVEKPVYESTRRW